MEADSDYAGESVQCPVCLRQTVLGSIKQPPIIPAPATKPPSPKPRLRPCRACGAVISVRATTCPNCGEPLRPEDSRITDVCVGVLLAAGILFIGALVLAALGSGLIFKH